MLAAEPEMKSAGGLTDSWKEESDNQNSKALDDPTRESTIRLGAGGYLALRDRMILVDKLEERLQQEVVDCQFASSKQAELTALLREQMFWEQAYGMLQLRQVDPIGDNDAAIQQRLNQHYGQPNIQRDKPEQRWTGFKISYTEASDALIPHCRILNPPNSPSAASKLMLCQADNEVGDRPSLSVFNMAEQHEKAWATCFRHHNWATDEHQRLPYEECMASDDPLSKLCADDRAASPKIARDSCPKSFVVHAVDIPHLLEWSDRYAGHAPKRYVPVDPATETVDVFPSQSQGLEVAVLDPTSAASPGPVRPLRGEIARDIPGSALGFGAIIAIPKGTPVSLSIQGFTGGVNIKLVSISLPGGEVSLKPQFKMFYVPNHPGQPVLPTPGNGETLKFSMPPLLKYSMLKTEFLRQAQAYSSSLGVNPVQSRGKGRAGAQTATANNQTPTADDFARRRIYAKSIMPVNMDQDLYLNAAIAGATISAHLTTDMTDYDQSAHPDMAPIPRGSVVYLTVTARPSDMKPYFDVTITPAYVVSHGLNVPLRAKPLVEHVPAKESSATSTPQAPAGGSSVGPLNGAGNALGGLLGGVRRQVNNRIQSRQATAQQPGYETTMVVKTGALMMINTTEDTFVADAKPAPPSPAN